jgi:hypothetical protein
MWNTRLGFWSRARILSPLLALAVLCPAPATAATPKKADWVGSYTATVMGTGHVGLAAGRAFRVMIDIYRWTTPEERQKILDLIATKDGPKIRKGLDDLEDIGRLRIVGESGYALDYAWQTESGGKKQIVVAMNRAMASVPGVVSGSPDFLVGVGVLELDASGKGKGVLAPAVELAIQPSGQIDITESAADPVQLNSVEPRD